MEDLFEEIAPLVSLDSLEHFVALLERNQAPKQRQKIVDQSSKESHNNDGGTTTKGTSTKKNSWSQAKILAFLEILPLHARPVKTMKTPAQTNLKDLKSATSILKRARAKAVQSNEKVAWSQARKGPAGTLRQEWHGAQTKESLRQEAREFAKVLANRLPTKHFQSLTQFLGDYVETARDDDEKVEGGDSEKTTMTSKRKVGIRRLFNNVEKKLGDHVHLVAPELARFFYFDPPLVSVLKDSSEEEGEDEGSPSNNCIKKATKKNKVRSKAAESTVEEDSTTETGTKRKKASRSIVDKELKVINAQKRWNETKERFVTKLLALQNLIQNHNDERDNAEIIEEEAIATTLNEKEEEVLAEIVTANLKKSGVAASTAKEEDQSQAKKKKKKASELHQVHLIFDAVVVEDFLAKDKEYPLSSDTTVFVDNLPIDMTEKEMMQLYSRCGKLEAVEIFNQRPDLDPGPLTEPQLLAMAKKSRKQGRRSLPQQQHTGHVNRWARPRTPVYGMLTFANEEAAQSAAQDALRIFGMIVQGHSIRSLKGKEMTRLYVDNIERDLGLSAMDIEYKLSQLLNPNLYVSLDITSSTHKKSKRVSPGSFEIMFPTFEVAFESFLKLREDLDLVRSEECTVGWIKTPLDANKYWTRQLGGVV